MKKTFLLLIATAFLFASCASKTDVRIPPEVSLAKGLKYFKDGDYYNAIPQFENTLIEAESPEMAAQAQLFLADSYFMDKKYTEAIPAYEQYLEIYGDDKEADKALLRLGLSHYAGLESFDRDMGAVEKSLIVFTELRDRSPEYTKEHKLNEKIVELKNMLAGRELYVAKFYFRTFKPAAAMSRLEYLIENYQGTEAYEEGLLLYAEKLSKQEGKEMEAVNAYQKLIKEYPKSNNTAAIASRLTELLLKVTEKLEAQQKTEKTETKIETSETDKADVAKEEN